MMSWLPWAVLALALLALGAALMHQPGVKLYDWIATRARRPQPAAKPAVRNEAPAPLTQTG